MSAQVVEFVMQIQSMTLCIQSSFGVFFVMTFEYFEGSYAESKPSNVSIEQLTGPKSITPLDKAIFFYQISIRVFLP